MPKAFEKIATHTEIPTHTNVRLFLALIDLLFLSHGQRTS